jgi:hypothetical protein
LSLVGRLIVDSSGKKSKNVSDSYKSHLWGYFRFQERCPI